MELRPRKKNKVDPDVVEDLSKSAATKMQLRKRKDPDIVENLSKSATTTMQLRPRKKRKVDPDFVENFSDSESESVYESKVRKSRSRKTSPPQSPTQPGSYKTHSGSLMDPGARSIAKTLWLPKMRHQMPTKKKRNEGDKWFDARQITNDTVPQYKNAQMPEKPTKSFRMLKVPLKLTKLQKQLVKRFSSLQRFTYNILVCLFHISENPNYKSQKQYLEQSAITKTLLDLRKKSNALREELEIKSIPDLTFFDIVVREIFILKDIPITKLRSWLKKQRQKSAEFYDKYQRVDPLLQYVASGSEILLKANLIEETNDSFPMHLAQIAIRDFVKAKKQLWKLRKKNKGQGKRFNLTFRTKKDLGHTLKLDAQYFGQSDSTWTRFLQSFLPNDKQYNAYKFGSKRMVQNYPIYEPGSDIALSDRMKASGRDGKPRIKNQVCIVYHRRLGNYKLHWSYEQHTSENAEKKLKPLVSLDPGVVNFQGYYSEQEAGIIGENAWKATLRPLYKIMDQLKSKRSNLENYIGKRVISKSFIGLLVKCNIIGKNWQDKEHFMTLEKFRAAVRGKKWLKPHLHSLLNEPEPALEKETLEPLLKNRGSFYRFRILMNTPDDRIPPDHFCRILTKGEVNQTKRNLSRAIDQKQRRIKNLVDELHWQTISYLSKNFETVVIPPFETQEMARKKNRKLNSDTARGMMYLRHYEFRMRLTHKMTQVGGRVVLQNEAYTSKSCTECGTINQKLGGSREFKCKKCSTVLDRDVNGARNIQIRALNEQSHLFIGNCTDVLAAGNTLLCTFLG